MSNSKAIRTSKNALMLLFGTIARMVGSFAFVLYSASLLGVVGFGKLSITIHFFELFLSLVATAAGILLTRDSARWRRNRNGLFTSSVILVALLCVAAPFVIIPLAFGMGYSKDTIQAIGISCLALIPASISVLYEAEFVAHERAEFVTAGIAVESLVRIGLSILVLKLGYGLMELSWVLVLSRTALAVYYFMSLRTITGHAWEFSWRLTRRFMLRWRVFAAENWMATIYTNLDVLVLSWISGEAAVGLYSAAWKFVRLGAVFAKSFTTAVFPVMSRMYKDSKDSFNQLFRHTVRIMCMIALPAIVGVSVFTDGIVGVMYTDEYKDAGPILRVLIWVLLLEFLNPFLSHVLFSKGKQKQSMYVAAIGLCVNSSAAFLLVRQFGAMGAAIGCILGGLVATLCYLFFASKLDELFGLILEIIRVSLAACGMGCVLYLFGEAPWPFIGFAAAVSYVVLLFVVRAIRINDLRFVRRIFFRKATA